MDTAATDPQLKTDRSDFQDLKPAHLALIIIFGVFATTLAQPSVLGRLPLQFLLKNVVHVSRTEMASFFFLCALPWYFKPFAGVLTDAFPLFGTRRRAYLLLSTVMAAISWVVLGTLPHQYNPLLLGCIVLNLFTVMTSTVIGAFLVETGQRLKATGRLTALRLFVQNFCSMVQGPIGGRLVHYGFLIAVVTNAAVALTILPVAYLFLKEKPHQRRDEGALIHAGEQIKTLFRSKPLWWALLFILLFYFSPGFSTPLLYRQIDDLKFSPEFIGLLGTFGGGFGLLSAVIYGFMAKRVNIRTMLLIGVVLSGAGTLFYLFYTGKTQAILIESQNGLFFGLAEVALLDLAARATPAGCEGMGYGLILSLRNVAGQGADVVGSRLADAKVPFSDLVFINSATTLLVLVLLPFLPKILMQSRDDQPTATSESAG